jgi:hemerythrin
VQAKYKAGNTAVLSMEVMSFLRDWLLKHIQGSDRALGTYLQAQKTKRVA